jgi:hypothetical protein
MRRTVGWQGDAREKVVVAKKGGAFLNTYLNIALRVVRINL